MRILFGAVLGLLIAYPPLLALVLGGIALAVSQPAVLAVATGWFLWPHLARRARGWLR